MGLASIRRIQVPLCLSIVFLTVITFCAVFAPYVTHYAYDQQNILHRLESPEISHWFGTDILGRDLYSRVVYGARVSLSIGVATALASLVLGIGIGVVAGYLGGALDILIMAVVDLIYIFPATLLAILLTMALGHGFTAIFIALTMTSWIPNARLVRSKVMQLKNLPFIEAQHALGAGHFRIIGYHILPNLMGFVFVMLAIQIPANILAESFLSFIGLGLQPPYSSWGILANEGFRGMQSFPHLILFPGAVIFFTLLSFNIVSNKLALWFEKGGRNLRF